MREIKCQYNFFSTLLVAFFFLLYSYGQGTSIGPLGMPPDPSAALDVNSPNGGVLFPRLTTSQRNAVTNPAESLIIFNTTDGCLQVYYNLQWQNIWCGCSAPSSPIGASHLSNQNEITWNWYAVDNADGYKYNTVDNYATATDYYGDTTLAQSNLLCDSLYVLYVWAYDSCGASEPAILSAGTSVCFTCGMPFTDNRDGRTYNTVLVGNQCWMAENLDYGLEISAGSSQANNGVIEKHCYDCPTYGGLYQWDEAMQYVSSSPANPSGVRGVCPVGWHLPSDEEWCELENTIETGTDPGCSAWGQRGVNTGGDMKDTSFVYWNTPNDGATNASGFTALPGGSQFNGSYSGVGNHSNWWCATENTSAFAWSRNVRYNDSRALRHPNNKQHSYSVRCVKD